MGPKLCLFQIGCATNNGVRYQKQSKTLIKVVCVSFWGSSLTKLLGHLPAESPCFSRLANSAQRSSKSESRLEQNPSGQAIYPYLRDPGRAANSLKLGQDVSGMLPLRSCFSYGSVFECLLDFLCTYLRMHLLKLAAQHN